MEGRALYRGAFGSVKELKDESLTSYRVHDPESAKPFKWTKCVESIIESVQRVK